MKAKNILVAKLAFALLGAIGISAPAHAVWGISGVSAEFATGNKTQMVRVGLPSDWSSKWFEGNGTHLGGYSEMTLAQWRGTRYNNIPGATQNLTDIGYTPVFRWQSDDKRGLYFEAAIGIHLLSGLYNNNGRRLSTAFQFGDHLGIGYVVGNWDLGLKIQHFSNGSIKQPNNGVNFAVMKAAYRF